MEKATIQIYTDGSCHTQLLVGAWAAIIFIDGEKVILKDIELNTTHNRMELLGIINAVKHVAKKGYGNEELEVYSDSQYAVNLLQRMAKLKHNQFLTKKGTLIQNSDLVQELIGQIETYNLKFIKVKAHQKNGDKINREVDIIVRHLVRINSIEIHER